MKNDNKFLYLICITIISLSLSSISFAKNVSVVAGKSAKTKSHVPGQLLVKFKVGTSSLSVQSAHHQVNSTSMHAFRVVDGLKLVAIPPGLSLEEAIAIYEDNPNVEYVEYDSEITAFSTNDTSYSQLWGLNNTGQNVNGTSGTVDADVNIPEAWTNGGSIGSNSIVVAVIDSGVNYNHPDLLANMWVNPNETVNGLDDDGNGYVDDIYGINAITNSGDPMDDNNHGTHVAGTIAAVGNNSEGITGINQQAKIVACKFLNAVGSGTSSDALKCMDYLYDLKQSGVNIILSNNSWGGGSSSQSMLDAIDQHRKEGMLFVAAAGNDSTNNDSVAQYPSNYYKANLISVAATDQNDATASFSNYGRRSVHVGAPGVNILSTVLGTSYSYLQGTSMATPHVSGLIALMKAQNPSLDWKALKNLTIASGTPLVSLASNTVTGRRIRAWDVDGTGAMSCTSQSVQSQLYPQVDSVTKIEGTKLGLAILNIDCASPAGTTVVTTSGPSVVTDVTLQDDGLAFDQVAGDGIYSAYWTAPSTPGSYTLTFASSQTLTVNVLANTSTLTPYRAPISIAYSPRTDASGYTPAGDTSYFAITGFTSYFNIPFGGENVSSIYGTVKGTNLMNIPSAAQKTGNNSVLADDGFETLVAGYWDDLDLSNAGDGIRAWWWYNGGLTPPGEIIFEWKGVHKTSGNPVNIQIVYTANSSDVEMIYTITDDNASTATVGIQVDPTRGTTQSYNTYSSDLAGNQAWLWKLDTGLPTADAGTVQNVNGNVLVTLSGTGSDPDGGALSYQWSQTAGTAVVLAGAATQNPSFTAPNNTETLTFLLTVTDDANQSITDTVNINVTASAAAGTLQFTTSTYTVDENGTSASISVERVGGSAGAVGITYATAADSATAAIDYTHSSGTLNWADADVANKVITVPIVDDGVYEGDEDVLLSLSSPSGGASIGVSAAVLTIQDNETPNYGTISVDAATYSIAENGGSVTITVNRTGGSEQAVSVDYATSNDVATSGNDYTAVSGTLSWADGENTPQTVVVAIDDDIVYEDDETFNFTLSNFVNATVGTSTSVVTITENEIPNYGTLGFSATTYSVQEDGVTATITVDRTGASDGTVSIDYSSADLTATSGDDYTSVSGTLNWLNGESTSKTINITISDDAIVEVPETVNLTLSNNVNAALGVASSVLTINDNDVSIPGTLALDAASYQVAEDGTEITISVTRSGGVDGVVSVDYATSNGSALSGFDYISSASTLSWADGESGSKSFTLLVSDDSDYEGDETVNITLFNIVNATLGNATALLTIIDDESPITGTIEISSLTYSVGESSGSLLVTVDRVGGSSGAVSVDYATANDSAIAGVDYTQNGGMLAWLDGDTVAKTFSIAILDDTDYEGDEQFTIVLSNVSGTVLGVSNATVTIVEDDVELVPVEPNPEPIVSAGILGLSSSEYSVNEAEASFDFVIVRIGGSDGQVSVNFEIVDVTTTSSAGAGTLTWADGDTEDKLITINLNDDAVYEGEEQLSISLSSPTGDATLDITDATLTIVDNDPPDTLQFITESVVVDESNAMVTINVARVGGGFGVATVEYGTVDSTATVGDDYEETIGTLQWEDGDINLKSIAIPIVDDEEQEEDESFIFTLRNPGTHVSLTSISSTTITILANDGTLEGVVQGGCFIATAAYGSNMEGDVRLLRAFRDKHLLTNEAGRWFVKMYYIYSPPIARKLAEHDELRAFVRKTLTPLVWLSEKIVTNDDVEKQTKNRP